MSSQAVILIKFRLISSLEKLHSHGTIFPAWERAAENAVPIAHFNPLITAFISSGLLLKRLRQARIDSQPAVSGAAKVAKFILNGAQLSSDDRAVDGDAVYGHLQGDKPTGRQSYWATANWATHFGQLDLGDNIGMQLD